MKSKLLFPLLAILCAAQIGFAETDPASSIYEDNQLPDQVQPTWTHIPKIVVNSGDVIRCILPRFVNP